MAFSSTDFGLAPMKDFTTSPPTNTWMVGRLITPCWVGTWVLVLVSILRKVTLSLWSRASSSMIGDSCLQGAHQSAQ